MKSSRVSSLASRSSSRWRWRSSTSARPWCFSGGGRSDLASTAKSCTRSDSSPRRVRSTVPSAPIRSPRSRLSSRSNASSPSSLTRAISWIRPERSTRSRNAALPCSRRAARRPATRRGSFVSPPGSSPSNGALTSAIGMTPGYVCGNGSIPSARRASSLRRRVARSSASPPAWVLIASGYVNLGDLELELAAGHGDGDHVVSLAAQQRLADRGLVGEPLVRRVGLGRADDRVRRRLARLVVLDVDQGAHAHDVVVELGGVDHRGRAQLVLERGDPRLEHRLLVLGVVVLGVLRDVPELAGLLDALGDLAALGGGEVLDLLLEVLEAFGGEDDVLLHQGRPLRRR